jgi:hypothetical protein
MIAAASGAQRPTGRGMNPRQGAPDQRRELEDEVRRNFARAVRERVGLNDEQMAKLGPLTRKYEDQRRATQVDERDARSKLQALVLVGTDADSTRIKGFVAQLMEVRRRRLTIDEAEQKELATIMSPMQQAKFLGLQEQVRRRLEQARPFPGGPPDDGGFGPGRPEPRPETAPDSVFMRFNVRPANATIRVDDVERGTGRARFKVLVGSRRLVVSAPGCRSVEQVVDAKPGPEAVVTHQLSCP